MPPIRCSAVIVAAGEGTRLAARVRKGLVELAGRPLFLHSVDRLREVPDIVEIVVVLHPDDLEPARGRFGATGRPHPRVEFVAGGAARWDSVRLGIAATDPSSEFLLVHDAARPFVPASVVEAVVRAAAEAGAAVPGVPVKDTIQRVAGSGLGKTVLRRDDLVAIQTPQGFRRDVLARALEAWDSAEGPPSDESQVVLRAGGEVRIVPGAEENFKVTTPFDLVKAEAWLARGREASLERTGFGWDRHRLEKGRPLRLAGVEIPHEFGLSGHSDGDVALHALCDALLGAAVLGDIGEHFPDTDPRFRGADSRRLLEAVVARLAERGLRPVCVDLTLVAERPKLSPHKDAMRDSVSALLGVDRDCVSVKAKTAEGLGPVGTGLAMEAYALATLAITGTPVSSARDPRPHPDRPTP